MKRFLPQSCTVVYLVGTFLASHGIASATVFRFDSPPFQGSPALTTPGRQVVGGEQQINFSTASDVFSLNPSVFGIQGPLQFANNVVENLPTSGVNVVVLQTFDNDADPTTPFGAGNAANLIAAQITSPGPGFFVYFNSGLDLPRLVFSTDLSDNQADLQVIARMLNLTGQAGRDAFPTFTAANFQFAVPESGNSLLLLSMSTGLLLAAGHAVRRRNA